MGKTQALPPQHSQAPQTPLPTSAPRAAWSPYFVKCPLSSCHPGGRLERPSTSLSLAGQNLRSRADMHFTEDRTATECKAGTPHGSWGAYLLSARHKAADEKVSRDRWRGGERQVWDFLGYTHPDGLIRTACLQRCASGCPISARSAQEARTRVRTGVLGPHPPPDTPCRPQLSTPTPDARPCAGAHLLPHLARKAQQP